MSFHMLDHPLVLRYLNIVLFCQYWHSHDLFNWHTGVDNHRIPDVQSTAKFPLSLWGTAVTVAQKGEQVTFSRASTIWCLELEGKWEWSDTIFRNRRWQQGWLISPPLPGMLIRPFLVWHVLHGHTAHFLPDFIFRTLSGEGQLGKGCSFSCSGFIPGLHNTLPYNMEQPPRFIRFCFSLLLPKQFQG